MKPRLLLLSIFALLIAGAAWADADPEPRKAADADFTRAQQAIADGAFPRAATLLEGVVGRDPKNADAFNLLGLSLRKAGRFEPALAAYSKALALEPDHRGAHEYIGEAYLSLGDLPRAKLHLARLDSICWLGCGEYDDLQQAIAAYERRAGK